MVQVGTGFTLVYLAHIMAKNIKILTGRKPNTRLLAWHILNICLIAAFGFIESSAYLRMSVRRDSDMDDPCQEMLFEKARYQYNWLLMFKILSGYYFDFFLLFLIHKFTSQ